VQRTQAEKDGITQGLICVLSTPEMAWSFDVQGNHRTHKLEVVRRPRKCLHLYFYFIDPEFGLMHVRLQSWFPFQMQAYINGREWLARQLEKRGVRFRRYENALLEIEDLGLAQDLSSRLGRRKWPRLLDAFARRANPLLPVLQRFGDGHGYYWVVDQCETATDIMWKDRASLAALMPDLFDHAISAFSAEDVMRFLGRKLNGTFKAEVVSDDKKVPTTLRGRPEGRRIKHRVARNWIKFYDKWSVLRVETVINNPGDFRILRVVTAPKGRKKRRWMRMAKGRGEPLALHPGRPAGERALPGRPGPGPRHRQGRRGIGGHDENLLPGIPGVFTRLVTRIAPTIARPIGTGELPAAAIAPARAHPAVLRAATVGTLARGRA
jgi:hypothetical protein